MSETTDPTAGEREEPSVAIKAQNPDLATAWRTIAWWEQTCGYWQAEAHKGYALRDVAPAEPDAGDVEALAKAVYRSREVNLPLADSLDVDCHDVARAVLASDWLDAVRRKAGADALTEAAEAIETDLPGSDATGYYASGDVAGYNEAARHAEQWLRDRAARVAGESR